MTQRRGNAAGRSLHHRRGEAAGHETLPVIENSTPAASPLHEAGSIRGRQDFECPQVPLRLRHTGLQRAFQLFEIQRPVIRHIGAQ